MELVIVTGLSGAGRRSVLGALEDIGCTSLDNIPARLLESLLELESELNPNRKKLAVGMDSRHAEFAVELEPLVRRLIDKGILVYVVFIEASDDVIIRRFSEARRPHFFAQNRSLVDAIAVERDLLRPVRDIANAIINTSSLSLSQLRQHILDLLPNTSVYESTLHLMSFGFKYGVPVESDMVMDARFLPNPYYLSELRDLTGEDEKVQAFLMSFDSFTTFLALAEEWIAWSWPHIQKEGRIQHSVAVGCTGGKHRSVALVDILAQRLRQKVPKLMVVHQHLYK
jgi:UPF0042 nucleotide-binding protein